MKFKAVKNDEALAEKKKALSKRGKHNRNKGSSYERTIAKKFKEKYDVDLTRTPQSGGFAKNISADDFRGDIITLDKDIEMLLHIECKNHRTWSLPKWLEQAESDCPDTRYPCVIFHKDGTSKDYITLSLTDFMSLVDKESIFKQKSSKGEEK